MTDENCATCDGTLTSFEPHENIRTLDSDNWLRWAAASALRICADQRNWVGFAPGEASDECVRWLREAADRSYAATEWAHERGWSPTNESPSDRVAA